MAASLIHSSVAKALAFPPKPPNATLCNTYPLVEASQDHQSPQFGSPLPGITISRREIVLLLSPFGSLVSSFPACAFNIGISGPKDWLRAQKKKSAKFLLAPIDASREILRAAFLLLTVKDSGYERKDSEEVRRLVRSAARDCVPQERNPFVAFQAKTGVEVCTFTLIVKNASSLLDDKDPTKLEAEAILNDLLRSFTLLNDMAIESDIKAVLNRQKLSGAVMDAISSLNKFEQGIRDCLEV
ncbi:hypothetical protein Nepgr_006000 [Nepenthes gracilis]|uniref:Uncharacterized protein n=1 Tax=Nepenthes gracilis TaxID=150966 RepID=A0AAD3S4L6_NEPGR|nr:hypothetical protein Nepgr_006000 [Nepenthes gracilis]